MSRHFFVRFPPLAIGAHAMNTSSHRYLFSFPALANSFLPVHGNAHPFTHIPFLLNDFRAIRRVSRYLLCFDIVLNSLASSQNLSPPFSTKSKLLLQNTRECISWERQPPGWPFSLLCVLSASALRSLLFCLSLSTVCCRLACPPCRLRTPPPLSPQASFPKRVLWPYREIPSKADPCLTKPCAAAAASPRSWLSF